MIGCLVMEYRPEDGLAVRTVSIEVTVAYKHGQGPILVLEVNDGLTSAIRSAEDIGYLKDTMWVGTLGTQTDTMATESRHL
jgi:hypothetical protein